MDTAALPPGSEEGFFVDERNTVVDAADDSVNNRLGRLPGPTRRHKDFQYSQTRRDLDCRISRVIVSHLQGLESLHGYLAMATAPGLEPGVAVLETAGLPLTDTALLSSSLTRVAALRLLLLRCP